MMKPEAVEKENVPVNHLKLEDVEKLLIKHYGPDWKSGTERLSMLQYYRYVFIRDSTGTADQANSNECTTPAHESLGNSI